MSSARSPSKRHRADPDPLSSSSSSSSPPLPPGTPFISNLWQLLHDPAFQHHIRWGYQGTMFVVAHNHPTFASQTLPQFYRHSNPSSFIRQLNLYGFTRLSPIHLLESLDHLEPKNPVGYFCIDHAHDLGAFSHPCFKQGHKELLGLIKPKTNSNAPASRSASQNNPASRNETLYPRMPHGSISGTAMGSSRSVSASGPPSSSYYTKAIITPNYSFPPDNVPPPTTSTTSSAYTHRVYAPPAPLQTQHVVSPSTTKPQHTPNSASFSQLHYPGHPSPASLSPQSSTASISPRESMSMYSMPTDNFSPGQHHHHHHQHVSSYSDSSMGAIMTASPQQQQQQHYEYGGFSAQQFTPFTDSFGNPASTTHFDESAAAGGPGINALFSTIGELSPPMTAQFSHHPHQGYSSSSSSSPMSFNLSSPQLTSASSHHNIGAAAAATPTGMTGSASDPYASRYSSQSPKRYHHPPHTPGRK